MRMVKKIQYSLSSFFTFNFVSLVLQYWTRIAGALCSSSTNQYY